MVDLAPIFVRRALPRLLEDVPDGEGIKEWLQKGAYSIRKDDADKFVLTGVDREQFRRFLLFDYQRFSLSAVESFKASVVQYSDPKSKAWNLLTRYYGAFFSAHALMRVTASGVLYLESETISHLTEFGRLFYGNDFSVFGGSYLFRLVEIAGASPEVEMRRLSGERASGNHELFWKAFNKFLGQLAEDVVAKQEPNATLLAGRIDELQRLLKSDGQNGGAWLSVMRNKLNYQHQFGVWFPYRPPNREKISQWRGKQNNAALRLDFRGRAQPLVAFDAALAFACALNIDVADRLVDGVARDNAFARDWRRLNEN